MKFDRFEDMIVWQKGQELAILGYKNLSENKDYTFKNQFLGASMSITNNIAEGFERRSNKEFKQFLFISKGSAGEVRNMLYLAKNLKYVNELGYNEMMSLCLSISKMLSALIKKL